jgi:glutamate racemase
VSDSPLTARRISADGPIGVFDSGMGGLSVAKPLLERLPHETLLYVGDTANLPFGPKSIETVRQISLEICDFLIREGAKLVIIACNTATAAGLAACQEAFPDVPILGMVTPGVRAALAATRGGGIAVVGTLGTITSGEVERAIRAQDASVRIVARENEDLLRLAEQGGGDNPALLHQLAEASIPPALADGADTLLLACTDYTCIRSAVDAVVPSGVIVIDPAEAVVDEAAALLLARGLARTTPDPPRHRFCVTDPLAVPQFRDHARAAFGIEIGHLESIILPARRERMTV